MAELSDRAPLEKGSCKEAAAFFGFLSCLSRNGTLNDGKADFFREIAVRLAHGDDDPLLPCDGGRIRGDIKHPI